MPDFDLTGELSLKIELHMLRPITEKVHSGNGPVSLVCSFDFDLEKKSLKKKSARPPLFPKKLWRTTKQLFSFRPNRCRLIVWSQLPDTGT